MPGNKQVRQTSQGEKDPVFVASPAYLLDKNDVNNIKNLPKVIRTALAKIYIPKSGIDFLAPDVIAKYIVKMVAKPGRDGRDGKDGETPRLPIHIGKSKPLNPQKGDLWVKV